jgi:hypothetical protein
MIFILSVILHSFYDYTNRLDKDCYDGYKHYWSEREKDRNSLLSENAFRKLKIYYLIISF